MAVTRLAGKARPWHPSESRKCRRDVSSGEEALSRYEVECAPALGVGAVGRLREVKGHTLFENSVILPQPRLFDLGEVLGDEGWMKFLKLDEYAPRRIRLLDGLQQVLFPYTEAV